MDLRATPYVSKLFLIETRSPLARPKYPWARASTACAAEVLRGWCSEEVEEEREK
jgi:hypothetical protein